MNASLDQCNDQDLKLLPMHDQSPFGDTVRVIRREAPRERRPGLMKIQARRASESNGLEKFTRLRFGLVLLH